MADALRDEVTAPAHESAEVEQRLERARAGGPERHRRKLAEQVPECVDDFCAWRPLSYCEHFAASRFRERDLAIAVYGQADPALRRRVTERADSARREMLRRFGVTDMAVDMVREARDE